MLIRPVQPSDASEWLRLRNLLWPGSTTHEDLARHFTAPPAGVVLVVETAGSLIGFAEISIRQDYVEGCSGSPVPFLEGWFIDAEHRHCGLGRQLLEAAAEWARQQGFREFGSNAVVTHESAIAAHLACGFEEVERTVHFIRKL